MLSRFYLILERNGRTEGQTDERTDGRTDIFVTSISRVSILTRDIDIANLSVSPSVYLSVTFRYQIKTA